MDKIEKWLADRCGVELDPDGTWEDSVTGYLSPWTIKDPRCMEVCREKTKMRTEFYDKQWHCAYWDKPMSMAKVHMAGKTIAEAEIACLQAIYKENNDD